MYSVEKGKSLIIATITIVLVFESIINLFSILVYIGDVQTKIIEVLLGVVVMSFVFFFLLKGHSWAKLTSGFLISIVGSINVLALITSGNRVKPIVGIIYIVFGLTLIFSKDVKNYIDFKKGKLKDFKKENDFR